MDNLIEIEKRIKNALKDIRPFLQEDEGDVEFVRFEEETNVCEIRPLGNCNGCPLWMMTLRAGIERHLIKEVPQIRRIESV